MNNCVFIGRISSDLELRYSQSGMANCKFNLAVDREYQKSGEEKKTDFLRVVVFGKNAEHVSTYLGKGRLVAIRGSIQTGSYEKDGIKKYTTDIIAERVDFLDYAEKKEKAEQDLSKFETAEGEENPF